MGNHRVLLAALLVATTSTGACASARARAASGRPAATATVVHLDDGDTVDVRIAGVTERVRLIGIDTPETKKPNTPVQCFGPEASAYTAGVLPIGTRVRLERDVEPRDPYHRLLAYVYRVDDGLFVNLELARLGYADTLDIEPNGAHAAEFAAAVRAARQQRLGLWGACARFGAVASPARTGAAGGR
jgi:micrococcal nuclease